MLEFGMLQALGESHLGMSSQGSWCWSRSHTDDRHSRFHPAGTASMGTVVDSDCKVKGVDGLRVVDASILPLPIAAHYQASMYAVAEAGADIILGKNNA